MIKHLLSVLLLFSLPLSQGWAATTVYVSDRLEVPLYDTIGDEAKVIRHVAVGDPLEVVKRDGDLLQVRAPGGELGWLAEDLVTAEEPPRQKLLALEAERGELRSRLRVAEGKLAGAGVAGVENPVPALERELERVRAENAALRARIDAASAALSGRLVPRLDATADWHAWVPWAGGVLVLGFIAGFLFHRFRHCRSHGGFRITLG